MSGLFKQPKVEKAPNVDPADLENRRGAERLRRLSRGGSNATLLTQGMAAGSGAPRATLTGMG